MPGFADDAQIAVSSIYNLLRVQRNDLGHPKETPPSVDHPFAFAQLQLFPYYYEKAEQIRECLQSNRI